MDFPLPIPFVTDLGLQLERFADGSAELSLQLAERHGNSFGVAHGGLLMTMLDVAMAHAARSLNSSQADGGPGLVTIEMKTSFMRPGLGHVRALGQVLHHSAKLAFCEGRVLNEQGQLCAHATATFKFLRALPLPRQEDGRRSQALLPRLQGEGSD